MEQEQKKKLEKLICANRESRLNKAYRQYNSSLSQIGETVVLNEESVTLKQKLKAQKNGIEFHDASCSKIEEKCTGSRTPERLRKDSQETFRRHRAMLMNAMIKTTKQMGDEIQK